MTPTRSELFKIAREANAAEMGLRRNAGAVKHRFFEAFTPQVALVLLTPAATVPIAELKKYVSEPRCGSCGARLIAVEKRMVRGARCPNPETCDGGFTLSDSLYAKAKIWLLIDAAERAAAIP